MDIMTVFRNNVNGFHLELTNKCTLKCPVCPRTEMINKFPKYWQNNNLNLQDLKNFLDIDITGMKFLLCGNYGDPIYYDDLIPLCKWLKDNNTTIKIVTNGSYQKEKFWKKLTEVLTSEDEIIWSIDGIPENFKQYRINADWDSIKKGIDIVTKTNVKTAWKFIIFNFNQNCIKNAEELSIKLGIQNFILIKSARWANLPEMKPTDDFVNYRYKLQNNLISNNLDVEVMPECKDGLMHFISSDGYYAPCCYAGIHTFYYKTPWGNSKTRSNFKIKDTTFTKIQEDSITIDFDNSIKLNSPNVCKFNCPTQNV